MYNDNCKKKSDFYCLDLCPYANIYMTKIVVENSYTFNTDWSIVLGQ
jgi:hypothetical protein